MTALAVAVALLAGFLFGKGMFDEPCVKCTGPKLHLSKRELEKLTDILGVEADGGDSPVAFVRWALDECQKTKESA